MAIAGHRAAGRKDHGEHGGGEYQGEDADTDKDSDPGHGNQPVRPGAMIVERGSGDRVGQSLAHGSKIRRRGLVDRDDDEAWNRQLVHVEALAKPGFEQSCGGGAIHDFRRQGARDGQDNGADFRQGGLHVETVVRLDLDGDLAGDVPLPGLRLLLNHGDRAKGHGAQERHDGDHNHQCAARDIDRRNDRRHRPQSEGGVPSCLYPGVWRRVQS